MHTLFYSNVYQVSALVPTTTQHHTESQCEYVFHCDEKQMVELFKSLSFNLHFGYLLHEPEIDKKNNKIYILKDKLTFKTAIRNQCELNINRFDK